MIRKVTIEHLASMVQKGFSETARKDEVKKGFDDVSRRFDDVSKRLEKIENVLIRKHDQEIENLKMRVRDLEDMFAMPVKR